MHWPKRLYSLELARFAASIHTYRDGKRLTVEEDWSFLEEYAEEWRLVSLPLDAFIGVMALSPRDVGVYTARSVATAPPVIAILSHILKGPPKYHLLDGNHRITAARFRGDSDHLAYVPCSGRKLK